MIVFNLLNFAFSKILSLKNSDWFISFLLIPVSFAFLGLSVKFICVDKLGVVSEESKIFSEVLRILMGGEFCIYGIISIIDISIVSSFKKNESCCHGFYMTNIA